MRSFKLSVDKDTTLVHISGSLRLFFWVSLTLSSSTDSYSSLSAGSVMNSLISSPWLRSIFLIWKFKFIPLISKGIHFMPVNYHLMKCGKPRSNLFYRNLKFNRVKRYSNLRFRIWFNPVVIILFYYFKLLQNLS